MSVGLVDVGAEGDLPLLGVLRYGRHAKHLDDRASWSKNCLMRIFFVRARTKIVFPDPGLDTGGDMWKMCDAVKIAARSHGSR